MIHLLDTFPADAMIAHETIQSIMTRMETSNTNQPIRNVLQLSHQHHVLLIFRRFVSFGGCSFCNRRTMELLEFYRSLTQLNILPVVVYPESKEKGEKFFNGVSIVVMTVVMVMVVHTLVPIIPTLSPCDPHFLHDAFHIYIPRVVRCS